MAQRSRSHGRIRALPRPGADLVAAAGSQRSYLIAAVVLCAAWLVMVARAARFGRSRALTVSALGVPVAAAVALWWLPPTLSIDAYSYLSHGYLAAQPSGNPYLVPSADVGGTGYGALLAAQGWMPVHGQSPYGALWTLWERLAYAASGDDLPLGVRLVTLPAFLGLLGSVALTWSILTRLAPARRLRGTLLVAANPVLLVELAGDGHNDGLVLFAVLLALWACSRGAPTLAVIALGLGALVKYTPLVLLPAVLAYLLTRAHPSRRAVLLRAAAALAPWPW